MSIAPPPTQATSSPNMYRVRKGGYQSCVVRGQNNAKPGIMNSVFGSKQSTEQRDLMVDMQSACLE
jgi:hypothetical protein